MGIAEYNKQCRNIVMRYSHEWEVSEYRDTFLATVQLYIYTWAACKHRTDLDVYLVSESKCLPLGLMAITVLLFYLISSTFRLQWSAWADGLTSKMTTRRSTRGSWRLSGMYIRTSLNVKGFYLEQDATFVQVFASLVFWSCLIAGAASCIRKNTE